MISGDTVANRLAPVITFALAGLLSFCIFVTYRQRIPGAGLFFAAWMILLLGILSGLIQHGGIIVPSSQTYNSIQLSAIFAIAVLGFGFRGGVWARNAGRYTAQNDIQNVTANGVVTTAMEMPDQDSRENAPAEYRRKATPENDSAGLSSECSKRRILLVDDEDLNLRIVESHIADAYHLTTARSGAEALESLSREKPDLIILDLMMPVMSGYQVCQIIRKRYDPDELPIVVLTAKSRVDDLVKALSVGANDYITKPFSKEELRVRIDKQFELMHLQHIKRDNLRLNWQLQRYEESERRLSAHEQRLAALLDVTGDPLLAIDEAGVVIYANAAVESLFKIDASDYVRQSINRLSAHLGLMSPAVAEAVHFPFNEAVISRPESTEYFDFELPSIRGRFCLMTLSQLDQEFYLLVFEIEPADASVDGAHPDDMPDKLSLPRIVNEINRNVERTRILGEYLQQIKPVDFQKHRELVDELGSVDDLINKLSVAMASSVDEDLELQYREALVKVMQDCQYYWQAVTGESIIDLAEKSRIWRVSIDNGRLRARSMSRYLSVDKLPSNPRWRQVARTAYFVLSRVSGNDEARRALESSVAKLQEIVEQKALS